MREKTLKYLMTFHTTSGAIAMEKYCKEASAPGRLIPVPRQITAGCGMAWCSLPEKKGEAQSVAREHKLDVDGEYELMI
ncbi:MAG: DUF3343 domain-containing protein [Lachnospiraceae bacterium]|jgi:hypothetical protein|nr:DUF3343 domain-containing protein [Lachnospiraceae bacterium]MDD3617567.1 DUF3343 domain-containing protein [Lachnospiraceae bacterium]